MEKLPTLAEQMGLNGPAQTVDFKSDSLICEKCKTPWLEIVRVGNYKYFESGLSQAPIVQEFDPFIVLRCISCQHLNFPPTNATIVGGREKLLHDHLYKTINEAPKQ